MKGKAETSMCRNVCQLEWNQLCFQKSSNSYLFVVGVDLQCFQTQRDLFEAVIWASSSPLVTNPTRAEVMRGLEGEGGVAGMKTAGLERRETLQCHFSLNLYPKRQRE